MSRALRVLALAPYPERIASTRFRVSRYIEPLARIGLDVRVVSWLDDAGTAAMYRPGAFRHAVSAGVRGALQQLRALRSSWDVVWVQREAMLAGPPVLEALARLRALPLVLDYDDAIWIAQGSTLKRAAKFAWKFDWVLRRATHAIAGSSLLANHARALGVPATVVPTVVERALWTPRSAHAPGPLTLGWIGTHSTAPQLDLIAPALRRLRAEGHAFRLVVVGAGPDFRLDGVEIERREWSLATEIDDFRNVDIGLAPMHVSPWHEGKCGFKQVQYMAVGVPCVSSLVGGARDFVVHDQNALVATTTDDWHTQISRLMRDRDLRARLSRDGRALVERQMCIEVQTPRIADVLRAAARQPTP